MLTQKTILNFIAMVFLISTVGCSSDNGGGEPDPTPDPITSIDLNETELQMNVDDTEMLMVTTAIGESPVTWTSDDPQVVQVDETGALTAMAGGTVQITVQVEGVTAVCTIVVAPDVFVAGTEFNGTYNVAKYWKNGEVVLLSDGGSNAIANSIFVNGPDVHVVGYESNPPSASYATYWLNGEETQLTDGSQYASAQAVFVYEDDVYIAGYESNGTKLVAKY